MGGKSGLAALFVLSGGSGAGTFASALASSFAVAGQTSKLATSDLPVSKTGEWTGNAEDPAAALSGSIAAVEFPFGAVGAETGSAGGVGCGKPIAMADATDGSMSLSSATFWRCLPAPEILFTGGCNVSASADSLVESTFDGQERSGAFCGEFSGGADDSRSLVFCATCGNDSALRVWEMMLKKSFPLCAGLVENPPGDGDGSSSAAAGSTGGKSDFVIIWR